VHEGGWEREKASDEPEERREEVKGRKERERERERRNFAPFKTLSQASRFLAQISL